MIQTIPEKKKIDSFLIFYVLTAAQIGVGILGYQRHIAKAAGYDAWISVVIAGIVMQVLILMYYKMLEITNGDLIDIHSYCFGKIASKIAGMFFIFYFGILTVSVLRSYIEVIQVWMFPRLSTFWFSVLFIFLVVYIINGGFRTVVGIAFFSFVLPLFIFPLFLFTLPYADFSNLLPIVDHSVIEILNGSRSMTYTVLGFEIILLVYPYIKNPQQSKKWAQISITFTTLMFLYLTIISFAYFPEELLKKNIWATLTTWKIIEMPFVERFEYIGIATWFIKIVSSVCIYVWAISRLIKRIYSVKQKHSVPVICLILLIPITLLADRNQINMVTELSANIGFYLNLIYFPLLFFATLIARKVKKK